jgi:hypothetical protein
MLGQAIQALGIPRKRVEKQAIGSTTKTKWITPRTKALIIRMWHWKDSQWHKDIMNKFTIDNLLTQLYGDDGRLTNKFIKVLPNAKDFKMIIQGKEIPLERIGINKSVTSHLEIVAFKNRRSNRYAHYSIVRLQNHVQHPQAFWKLVSLLTLRSKVWFIIHLQKVFPNWYRALPTHEPIKLMKHVRRLATDFAGNLDHRRCYIPKITTTLKEWMVDPDRRWRPLGVPTPAWRIYLSMLNTALSIWLEPGWQKQQHGYFPRKGTFTCWIEILKRIHGPTIYEFDLKQFFPSVQISYVSKILRESKMPKVWVEYFENLNKSQPKLNKEDKADEKKWRENKDIESGVLNRDQTWYGPVREFIKMNGMKLWQELVREDTGGFDIYHEYEFIQLQHAMFASIAESANINTTAGTTMPSSTGLPQGGGISPSLSVQVLKPLFKNNDAVMYADDGLIFGKPRLEHPEYQLAGIQFHPEKSGYIKQDGVWLKPLKFCGMIYDGWNDKLYSQTKKGNHLEIPKGKLKKLINAAEWYMSDGNVVNGNRWLQLLSSRLGGFVQAAYYNGTFELSEHWSNWEIKSSASSWARSPSMRYAVKKYGWKPTLYNLSTLASHNLLGRLSKVKGTKMNKHFMK